MKKLSSLLISLLLLLSSFAFVGCAEPLDENDGFVEVYHVEYTALGRTNSYYSKVTLKYELCQEITLSEFDSLETKFGDSNDGAIFTDSVMRENTHRFNVEIGKAFGFSSRGKIFKAVVKAFEFNYLFVKVVDSKSLFVKYTDGTVSLISAETYEIDYFR